MFGRKKKAAPERTQRELYAAMIADQIEKARDFELFLQTAIARNYPVRFFVEVDGQFSPSSLLLRGEYRTISEDLFNRIRSHRMRMELELEAVEEGEAGRWQNTCFATDRLPKRVGG